MLPLDNLDDRSFKDIVEDSRRKISLLNPEWTDENYHDPGITLLELFAWMTEIQQYRLDRITSRNELKFLRILGEKPAEVLPSKTVVSVSAAEESFSISAGTQFTTGNLVFETVDRFQYHPLNIEKILVVAGKDTVDFSSPNRYSKYGYLAFGKNAQKGDRMLIGLSRPIPEHSSLSIYLDMFDDYPVPRGKWHEGESTFLPSGKLSWKYYGRDDHGGSWLPLNILRDESAHMSWDGILEVAVNSCMEPAKINPANDKLRYWLQCEVTEGGFEVVPRLNQIVLNTVNVEQKETLSRQEVIRWDGKSGSAFRLKNFQQYYGINRLQVQNKNGSWVYWNEVEDIDQLEYKKDSYYIEKDRDEKTVRLILNSLVDNNGSYPLNTNIRVISYLPDFEGKRLIGKGGGLPGEAFSLPEGLKGVCNLKIQIGGFDGDAAGRMVWQDWTQVEDFDASGPDDRHFVLDAERGEIYFGNDEHGAVPEASETGNICIIACASTAGTCGNIKENNLFSFKIDDDFTRSAKAVNIQKAVGGEDAEAIESAKERLLRDYFKPAKAVTAADYEALAKETPGVRIACAKAIPCFSPDMPGYPERKAEGHVTVVIVPFSERDRPVPSRNLLRNVQRYLEKNRLIGTQIHVIPAEYVTISVRAVIMVQIRSFDRQRVIAAINQMLEPFNRENGCYTCEFRHTLFKSDILGLLNQIQGVEYISELSLRTEGNGGRVTAEGDIELPPYGLTVAGSYEIEVKDVNER
jgi:hypothetical protein